MDILFEGLDLTWEDQLRFTVPTVNEVRDWLRQTEGRYTNEILEFLHLPLRTTNVATYSGSLSIPQQVYIIQTLNE